MTLTGDDAAWVQAKTIRFFFLFFWGKGKKIWTLRERVTLWSCDSYLVSAVT